MGDQNRICESCRRSAAACFCNCTGQKTLLCANCWPAHSTSTRLVHQQISITAYQPSSPSLPQLSAQCKAARIDLEKNLTEIDKCITELNAEIQKVANTVFVYGQELVDQLQQIKAEMNRVINEVIAELETARNCESPQFRNPLSKTLRHFTQDSLRLFTYRVDASAVIKAITSICRFSQNIQQPKLNQIAGIFENQLRVYNLAQNSSKMLTLPRRYCNDISICFLSSKTLLCVGSSPPRMKLRWSTSKTSKAKVTAARSLTQPRSCPGLCSFGAFAYVFGSIPRANLCERYEVVTNEWRPLDSMKYERGAFSSAHFEREMYLITTRHPFEVLILTCGNSENWAYSGAETSMTALHCLSMMS